MADLYTRTEVGFGGAMTAQFGIITPANGLSGVLMQNIQLSYQQQVTRIYELGNRGAMTNMYYIGGRSQGTMGAAHVIGPGVSMAAFYNSFGDVCKAQQNTCVVDLSPNICPGFGSTSAKYTCKYCVLVSVGVSVAAQDFVVNENSQLMFSGMQFDNA